MPHVHRFLLPNVCICQLIQGTVIRDCHILLIMYAPMGAGINRTGRAHTALARFTSHAGSSSIPTTPARDPPICAPNDRARAGLRARTTWRRASRLRNHCSSATAPTVPVVTATRNGSDVLLFLHIVLQWDTVHGSTRKQRERLCGGSKTAYRLEWS